MPLYRAELLAKKPLWHGALIHDVSQVLHLPFDWDDGSYARDRSSYKNDGIIYGATRAAGKIGMALSFDGVDDYVQCPAIDENHITVAAWVKLTSIKDFSHIVNNRNGIKFGYVLMARGQDGRWHFYVTADGTSGDARTSFGFEAGVWHFIVGTYDGETAKIYVDGELKGSDTAPSGNLIAGASNVRIGTRVVASPASGEYTDGIVDEVRIARRALSQDEIRMLMYRRF